MRHRLSHISKTKPRFFEVPACWMVSSQAPEAGNLVHDPHVWTPTCSGKIFLTLRTRRRFFVHCEVECIYKPEAFVVDNDCLWLFLIDDVWLIHHCHSHYHFGVSKNIQTECRSERERERFPTQEPSNINNREATAIHWFRRQPPIAKFGCTSSGIGGGGGSSTVQRHQNVTLESC